MFSLAYHKVLKQERLLASNRRKSTHLILPKYHYMLLAYTLDRKMFYQLGFVIVKSCCLSVAYISLYIMATLQFG